MPQDRPPEGAVLRSIPLFTLKPALLRLLDAARGQRAASSPLYPDEVEVKHDAFLLDGGMGTPSYLSRSGRILWVVSLWEVCGRRIDAFTAIAVGSWKAGIPELRSLLPARPPSGVFCAACAATGCGRVRASIGGAPMRIICRKCRGVGWTSPEVTFHESVLALS